MKIISVVGARPNFMKVAPLYRAFKNFNQSSNQSALSVVEVQHLICHTGQHYDEKMSQIIFDDLELPEPDFYLGIGSGSHAEQTGRIMIEFEKVLIKEKPDLVLVVGDVNSTIACTLTAAKLHIKTAHVEAGLRSGDRTMPEEINRILTDSISDYLFVTERSGLENLKKEGIPDEKVHFVGHVMIDSLKYYLTRTENSNVLRKFGVLPNDYILVTLHRPINVDNPEQLQKLMRMLNRLSEKRKIIFPVHPRTRKNLDNHLFDLPSEVLTKEEQSIGKSVLLCDPIGYIDFLTLIKNAELILTDSGGIQEESTYLGVQCITLRDTTERPVTVDIGTNQLLGDDLKKAEIAALEVLNGKRKEGRIPELWDGKAGERIVKSLVKTVSL